MPAAPILEARPVAATVPATSPAPAVVPLPKPAHRSRREVLQVQVALAGQGISCGPLDGVLGRQTRAALRAFQQREGVMVTGELDPATMERLKPGTIDYQTFVVGAQDLSRLHPVSATWLGKSQQQSLDYESILELAAERGRAHPNLVRLLNPEVQWDHVNVGTPIKLPRIEPAAVRGRAEFLRIRLAHRSLEAFDRTTNLLAYFPCSIAARIEKRPLGLLHVVKVARDPVYRFDPDIFQESEEARQVGKPLMLPAGPNNPVGTVWIGLDRPGYGIHGTPHPEAIGQAASRGCFRLANWDAEQLLELVSVGTPVLVER
jgi:lipoprotein-anchoring transpeptidase ErfK/SrfK